MSTDAPVENRLLALYRRFVGEPEEESDVYLGFALFFGGIALGALGLVFFLWSSALPAEPGLYWRLRELAITLAILGLPAFVLSLTVLLPVDRRARYAAGTGASICVVAAGVFVFAYPGNWNVEGVDYSTQGIAIYAAGLAVLAASAGAGLVGHHLERARETPGAGEGSHARTRSRPTGGGRGEAGETEAVSEERVRRDIEEAMEGAELTWGGVERDETKRLTIDTPDDLDVGGLDAENANTARSSGGSVDDAVDGLRKLQGRDRNEGTSDAVDEQAQALARLREQQKAEDEEADSTLARLRDRLGL